MDGSWLIIVIFLILLVIKLPVPIAVGIACAYGLATAGVNAQLIVSSSVKTLNSFTLLAVPFFILAGNIMTRGSIAAKLLNVAKAFFGDRKDAIAISTIVACAFFAALSGSATATVAALGPLCIPMMTDEGYSTPYACAIIASGAIVGPIIPPSIIMCVYGVQTNTSISNLFTAGFIPGILLSISMVIALEITKNKHNNIDFNKKSTLVAAHKGRYTAKEKLAVLWDSKWSLLMPVIVLGGIYAGIVTPSEAAVVSCVYVLIISFFVSRDMTIKDVLDAFRVTVSTMGGLMILLGLSTVFGNVLTLNMIPQKVCSGILGLTTNPILIMLAINVILLIAGCFMEACACIVIFTPIMLPLAQQCGITPLQFGIIMCVNLVIGTLTPPFGLDLYMASAITGEPVFRIAKKAIPFMVSTIIVLLIITYIPAIIDFLPRILGRI